MDTLEKVLPRTIFLTVAGSHLYGTNIATSDHDYKGVAIATKDYYLGYLKSFEQLERKVNNGHPHDLTITALWKFVNLATDCNPNVVELLFAGEGQIFHVDRFGEELVGIRDRFITKKARHTFSGYAHGQLKRIKSHRNWLLNPPKEKPTRKQFGLSETSKVSKSELGAFDAVVEKGYDLTALNAYITNDLLADRIIKAFKYIFGRTVLPKDAVTLFTREKQYQAAKTNWDQYENWKKTRNEARSALEAKFGYDTKHAMHLVRLMRMCKEILSTGQVLVRRPDAEELLSIRHGAWEYDRLIEHAETLDKECGALYETSSLAYEPDRVWLDDWLVDITERYLSSR